MRHGIRTALLAILAAIAAVSLPAAAGAQEAVPPADAPPVDPEPADTVPASEMPPPPELVLPAPPPEGSSTGAPPATRSVRRSAPTRGFSFRRYNQLTVRSADAEQFYYIRQDNFRALGTTDDERLSKLRTLPSFGPNPVGGAYSVYLGENYLFLPLCAGRLDKAKGKLNRLDGPNGSVTLTCR